MKIARIARVVGLGALLCLPVAPASGRTIAPAKPVALVYSLVGETALEAPSEVRRPLRLFDRLAAGSTVEVGQGSRFSLVFANGHRYELGASSKATVGRADLAFRSGPVRPLPAVPPLPRLSPIAEEEKPGLSAGAVRIRSERITGLYPRHGAATLAEATTLRFDPIAGGGKYQVEVQDRQGRVVFSIETTGSSVDTGRVLKPGMRYDWTVRTLERVGPVATGQADFVTLPSREAKAREALREAVETAGDGVHFALLGEVDRSLGLWVEARDELRVAVQRLPGDSALAKALDSLNRQIDEEEPEKGIGLVIETVTPESLGERAGLANGDLLLSWCRRAAISPTGSCVAGGKLESPFDFDEMESEQAPRGGVTVFGKRAAENRAWLLLPGSPSVEVRPAGPGHLLQSLEDARSLAKDSPDATVEVSRRVTKWAKESDEDLLGVWFLSQLAEALGEAQHWVQADALDGEALEWAESLGSTKVTAQILHAWGKAFQNRGVWEKAEDLYRRSLELDRAAGREMAIAWVLDNLGAMAAERGDLRQAEALVRQALEILEELAPGSVDFATSLQNLAGIAKLRGDLSSSEEQLRSALSNLKALAPESLTTAGVLIDLGNLEMARGNNAGGEELYRSAKALYERTRPESLEMAQAYYKLGITAVSRRDRETADYFLRRALAIQERLDPSGARVARTLEGLGLQAYERGDLEQAEEHLRRSVGLTEKLANDLRVAHSLQNLGVVLIRKGDCVTAEKNLQRALAIRQRLNPDSLDVAKSLQGLGFWDKTCGNRSQLESYERQALTIFEKLAPWGVGRAMTLHELGAHYLWQGRFLSAADSLCKAMEHFEALRESAGPEIHDDGYFTDCLGALVATGRAAEAFQVLERGRARAFLDQLVERDLVFSAAPPDEITEKRKQLAREIDATQAALGKLSSTAEPAEAERLFNRMREIRDEQRELTLQIRKNFPWFASLRYPEALDLAETRRSLDPGTVLLSYALGEKESFLFVIQPPEVKGPGVSAITLPKGEAAIREAVRSLRNLVQRGDSDRSQLTSLAAGLYDLLIGPAESTIAPAKRVLVSADGPLYALPFAALVRKGRYFVEWKPIHSILSATVYSEIKKERRGPAGPQESQLVAFGDPSYPSLPEDRETAPAGTLEILSAVRSGLSLSPLPATRKEVESIASLYPHARVYVGKEATEERAKSIGPEARLLHFASHGLLDERFPLNSALALSLPTDPDPDGDNGLLQAWEILESVRLDADLVTLSACDTALGQEESGEGLIGLTRAFQIAGARSVLASLWSVSDLSTADLMKRFYGNLRSGKPKDEALRTAQMALIRSQDFSHPYFWAAFQLSGDWN